MGEVRERESLEGEEKGGGGSRRRGKGLRELCNLKKNGAYYFPAAPMLQ